MKIEHVGKRGIVFTFDDLSTPEYDCPTNVYVINADKSFYICDTFLGPASMKGVKSYLKESFSEKPFIIFNSHSHWDHHWGNCAFPNSKIIAHELCLEKIQQNAEEELERNKNFLRGKVVIIPPNLLFKNNLNFEEDGVKLFHTPGHTEDSSSCYDVQDNILFAADNIEEPIPYLNSTLEGIQTYINSIKKYLELKVNVVIPGHGKISDNSLIEKNLEYLENFPELIEPVDLEKNGKPFYLVHISNLSKVASLMEKVENNLEAKNLYQKTLEIAKEINYENKEALSNIKQKMELL